MISGDASVKTKKVLAVRLNTTKTQRIRIDFPADRCLILRHRRVNFSTQAVIPPLMFVLYPSFPLGYQSLCRLTAHFTMSNQPMTIDQFLDLIIPCPLSSGSVMAPALNLESSNVILMDCGHQAAQNHLHCYRAIPSIPAQSSLAFPSGVSPLCSSLRNPTILRSLSTFQYWALRIRPQL